MRWCTHHRLALLAVLFVPLFAQGQASDPDPTKSTSAPASMGQYRGQNGKMLRFIVTGNVQGGTVWGSDIYTDDSAISAAVVHAGLLKDGETGIVKIVVVDAQAAYQGSLRNGVQTNNYNAWGGSYRFEGKAQIRTPRPMTPDNPMKDPVTLYGYRGQLDKVLYIEVVGKKNGGTVWGTDVYTDDSELARAAVHSGVVKDGEKKVIKVTILSGQQKYKGSNRNDVASTDYESWGGSYKIEAVSDKEKDAKDPPKK